VLAVAKPRSRAWFVAAVAAAGVLAIVTIPRMTGDVSAGVGATYTVTVQDSSSAEVWKRASWSDTSITVPDSVRLNPGSLYFWSVDARLVDGNTAKTGPHTFIVR
jgi:hypothetical protein